MEQFKEEYRNKEILLLKNMFGKETGWRIMEHLKWVPEPTSVRINGVPQIINPCYQNILFITRQTYRKNFWEFSEQDDIKTMETFYPAMLHYSFAISEDTTDEQAEAERKFGIGVILRSFLSLAESFEKQFEESIAVPA